MMLCKRTAQVEMLFTHSYVPAAETASFALLYSQRNGTGIVGPGILAD